MINNKRDWVRVFLENDIKEIKILFLMFVLLFKGV